MAIYDLKCNECGVVAEFLCKDSEIKTIECPECGGGPMEKKVSASSFSLKGSGWPGKDIARRNKIIKDNE